MSERISEYTTSVTALASGDLMDVSKLISTSPDVYQSQKLNYSVLLTELNADLSITLQSAYNASTQPQILTSVAKGGVVIRSGQALDTNSVLELKNIAGSSTFVVGGNGIVATGNWQATAIAAAFGGTGQTSYTIGDLIYASNTTAISKLGIGTSGQVLTVSGGGIPSWAAVSASNLGSANLTSADNARTFTLKSGGTATQYLEITNGVDEIIRFRGDKQILIGDSSNQPGIKFDPYGTTSWAMLQWLAAGTSYAWNVYSYSNQELFRLDSNGMILAQRPAGISSYMNYNASINFWASGTSSSIGFVQENGSNHTVYIGNSGGHGYVDIKNSSGVTKHWLIANGDSYFLNNLAIGVSSAAGRFDVKGAGATSATTTALFQNSSSVACLTIKDDLTSTFGGTATAPQIITTPATITVAANAGTVTRANRINKFTNSSAATMTITMSTTAALDGDLVQVRIYDFSAATQTITWVNTENSSVTVPATSNGSTTLYLTVGFQYNSATSKWRCIGSV